MEETLNVMKFPCYLNSEDIVGCVKLKILSLQILMKKRKFEIVTKDGRRITEYLLEGLYTIDEIIRNVNDCLRDVSGAVFEIVGGNQVIRDVQLQIENIRINDEPLVNIGSYWLHHVLFFPPTIDGEISCPDMDLPETHVMIDTYRACVENPRLRIARKEGDKGAKTFCTDIKFAPGPFKLCLETSYHFAD